MRRIPELEDVIPDPCSCNSPDRSSTHERGDENWCLDAIELGAAKGMFEYRQALRDTVVMVEDLKRKLSEKDVA